LKSWEKFWVWNNEMQLKTVLTYANIERNRKE